MTSLPPYHKIPAMDSSRAKLITGLLMASSLLVFISSCGSFPRPGGNISRLKFFAGEGAHHLGADEALLDICPQHAQPLLDFSVDTAQFLADENSPERDEGHDGRG